MLIIKTFRLPHGNKNLRFYFMEGKNLGISQNVVASLCGFSSSRPLFAKGRLGWKLSREEFRESLPESLQASCGEDIYLLIDEQAKNSPKLIKPEVAASLIAYYAFEAKIPSQVAKATFYLIATQGLESWVKTVVGWEEEHITPSLEEINYLIAKLNDRIDKTSRKK